MAQKFLSKETCEYLVSLGCVSESGQLWFLTAHYGWKLVPNVFDNEFRTTKPNFPAFSLEDILREDNAKKIWGDDYYDASEDILFTFQTNPDTWPEEVSRLIMPTHASADKSAKSQN